MINTAVWRITPPCVDLVGAVIVFTLFDWRVALVLSVLVFVMTTMMLRCGERGRPVHQHFAGLAGQTAAELIDTISSMWAVKAFSAHLLERDRLATFFGTEARAQKTSWMYIAHPLHSRHLPHRDGRLHAGLDPGFMDRGSYHPGRGAGRGNMPLLRHRVPGMGQ